MFHAALKMATWQMNPLARHGYHSKEQLGGPLRMPGLGAGNRTPWLSEDI